MKAMAKRPLAAFVKLVPMVLMVGVVWSFVVLLDRSRDSAAEASTLVHELTMTAQERDALLDSELTAALQAEPQSLSALLESGDAASPLSQAEYLSSASDVVDCVRESLTALLPDPAPVENAATVTVTDPTLGETGIAEWGVRIAVIPGSTQIGNLDQTASVERDCREQHQLNYLDRVWQLETAPRGQDWVDQRDQLLECLDTSVSASAGEVSEALASMQQTHPTCVNADNHRLLEVIASE